MITQHKQANHALRNLLKAENLPASDLAGKHTGITFFTIEQEGKILGSIGLEVYEKLGLLRSLVVQEKQRGKGFGKKLTGHLEQYAHQQSIASLYLLTETAEPFFVSLGYETISRNKAPESIQNSAEFSELCPSTAVLMVKNLDIA